MFENTNAPQHTAETSALYLEELNRVEEERNTARAMNLVLQEDVTKKANILSALTELVQEEFNKGGWDEDDEFFQGLCRYLDIETTEETEIEIVARWYVTVTHPKGMNLSDISVDTEEPSLDGDNCEFGYVQFLETEINEL